MTTREASAAPQPNRTTLSANVVCANAGPPSVTSAGSSSATPSFRSRHCRPNTAISCKGRDLPWRPKMTSRTARWPAGHHATPHHQPPFVSFIALLARSRRCGMTSAPAGAAPASPSLARRAIRRCRVTARCRATKAPGPGRASPERERSLARACSLALPLARSADCCLTGKASSPRRRRDRRSDPHGSACVAFRLSG